MRKFFSILLSLIMVLAMMPMATGVAWADVTIKAILPIDFPVYDDGIPSNAWTNGSGGYLMLFGDSLQITSEKGDASLAAHINSATLTEDGNNYKYTNQDEVETTFNMEDNVMVSVYVKNSQTATNGLYKPVAFSTKADGNIIDLGNGDAAFEFTVKNVNTVSVKKAGNGNPNEIIIPATVEYDNKTFTVTNIEKNAFKSCTNLATVTCLATTLPTLGAGAFDDCTSLATIYVPYEAVEVYKSAAGWNTYANNIKGFWSIGKTTPTDVIAYLDGTTLHIEGRGAMKDYGSKQEQPWDTSRTSITSVEIGEDVTNIGNYAFYGCTSLTNITIRESVTSIGESAFDSCNKLENIIIPASIESIGCAAFKDCTSLTNITIPASTTSIASYAFQGCKSITNITIPASTTSIDSYAFQDCKSITNITIPASMTSIGEGAFKGCSQLATVTCLATTPPTLGVFAFCEGVEPINGIVIYVPADSVEKYKAEKDDNGSQNQWFAYKDRIFEYITIEDILPNDFPITSQSGWVNENGARTYKREGKFIQIEQPIDLNKIVQKDGDNYKYGSNYTFIMTNGTLTSIKVDGVFSLSPANHNGEYFPYQFTNELIQKQAGYTGDIAFTTNGKYRDQDTVSVLIDEQELNENNYTVASSSNVILKGDYVKTLPAGTHKITIAVAGANGYDPISQYFTITSAPDPSPTPTYHGGYVHVETAAEKHAKLVEVAEAQLAKTEIKSKSKLTKLNGKKAVKISWSVTDGDFALLDFDGFDVFRSTKKYSGYGNTPYFTTTKTTYKNNKDLEKGKTYYYKVRAYKMVDGEKVYTGWSTKAWRTIK